MSYSMHVQDDIGNEATCPDSTTVNISVSSGSSLTEVLLDQLPYGAVFKIRGNQHTFVKVRMDPGHWIWLGEKNCKVVVENIIYAFRVTDGVIQSFQPGNTKVVEIEATLILHGIKSFTVL
jgi:hypothetical protein